MREDEHAVSRRDFIKTSGGAVAASMLAQPSSVATPLSTRPSSSAKMRYAIVGTGIRGITMWGRSVAQEYSDYVDIVGLCDINPGRLAFAQDYIVHGRRPAAGCVEDMSSVTLWLNWENEDCSTDITDEYTVDDGVTELSWDTALTQGGTGTAISKRRPSSSIGVM